MQEFCNPETFEIITAVSEDGNLIGEEVYL